MRPKYRPSNHWRLRYRFIGAREDSSSDMDALHKRIAELEAELELMRGSVGTGHSDRASDLMVDFALHAMVLVNREGKIVQINSLAEKLFGYAAEELMGSPIEVLVPESFRKQHPALRDAFFANPAVRPMGAGRDLYGQRKDGTRFPVEIGLSPIQTDRGLMVLGSILDISQRKRAEEMFRLAVESAPNAMVMINQLGEIVFVNQQTERLFGYGRNELVGRPIELLVPDRFRDKHPEYRKAFFENPAIRPMGIGRDLRGRRRDGTEFPVEIGLTPIESDAGLLVLSAIVDITERVQAEKRGRKHLAELAHAARLSAVGEMFSELAHEINQPLGAAANYARACVRLIQSDSANSMEQLGELMEKSAVQAVRAIEIVRRIGSFVKRSGPVHADLDINKVIMHVLSLPILDVWSGGVIQRVAIQLDLEQTLPKIQADRVQIEQVLVNLVRNAVDAMSDVPMADRRLSVQSRLKGSFIEVSVRDIGLGMTADQMANIFTPFFTTKQHGMGLGLSISKSIIECHSGSISVKSRCGEGTVFSFTLPVANAEGRT